MADVSSIQIYSKKDFELTKFDFLIGRCEAFDDFLACHYVHSKHDNYQNFFWSCKCSNQYIMFFWSSEIGSFINFWHDMQSNGFAVILVWWNILVVLLFCVFLLRRVMMINAYMYMMILYVYVVTRLLYDFEGKVLDYRLNVLLVVE